MAEFRFDYELKGGWPMPSDTRSDPETNPQETEMKTTPEGAEAAKPEWDKTDPQADIEAIRKRAAEQARYPWAPPLGQIFKDDIPALLDHIGKLKAENREFEEQIADWHDYEVFEATDGNLSIRQKKPEGSRG